MKQIIAVANIKGGTGKSTTAAALSQAAAADGQRVLAIDLDPQANFTFFLGADQNRPGTYQLLHGTPAAEVIQQTAQGIDAIAASPDLATEKTTPASAKRLQSALRPIEKGYDFIFIDTPTTMGELTYNALQAATGLIIPLETDSNALQGLYLITDIAQQIQKSNPALSFFGTILTRCNLKANIDRYLKGVIEEKGQELGAPLLGIVREGRAAIRAAQSMQQSLFEYDPKSKPAQDYKEIYQKITEG